MKPFIHIHIPKTAGSTRAFIFQKIYGGKIHAESVYLAGVNKRVPDYEKYDLITGHFFACVYDHLPLVTFLRDPVERVISHYDHFYKAYGSYAADDAKGGLPWDYSNPYPLRDIGIIEFAETWSNLQTKYVAGGNFEYIGVMEEFDNCLYELSILFDFEFPSEYKSYRVRLIEKKSKVSDINREIIAHLNKEDMELYEDVVNVRKGRR